MLIILFYGGSTSLRENFSPYTLSKIALVKLVKFYQKNLIIKELE